MFWRERERDTRDQNGGGGPPCGQVRVLVVGDSGVGKTSLVNLILKGSSITHPPQTIGCSVGVKHITYGNSSSSSNSIRDDAERDFFVELWDISGHERYKNCRSLFYTQINGVIFVHDLSLRRTKTSLHKWAAEVAATGSFSAPLGSGGPGGLIVPYLVIGNKADVASSEKASGSSGRLDAALQWVEKGLLPSSEELPLTDSFPGGPSLLAATKEARYDKEAVTKFFRMLIRRRYFSDELSLPGPWCAPSLQNSNHHLSETLIEGQFHTKPSSTIGETHRHNVLPPVPAQSNLPPPSTLHPQQPMSGSENYTFRRFLAGGLPDTGSTRSKRADINV